MSQPPDPVFPSLEDTDEKLVRELVEGKRSRSQAQRVLQELSGACKEASVELEVMLQVGRHWVPFSCVWVSFPVVALPAVPKDCPFRPSRRNAIALRTPGIQR